MNKYDLLLRNGLEKMGLHPQDVKKYMVNGTMIFDLESFIYNADHMDLWETVYEIEKSDFVEMFKKASGNVRNFFFGNDLVTIDGEKYIIIYVL